MEKDQNYFVVNKYSGKWDEKTINEYICFYNDKDHINLKPSSSYRVNKVLDVNLVTIEDKIQNISETEQSKSVTKKYFVHFDGNQFLYILNKSMKKIRRINIGPYEENTNQNQGLKTANNKFEIDFLDDSPGKFTLSCIDLENPQMLFVGITNIYVLSNTKLHLYSKTPSYNALGFIEFVKKVQFFIVSSDEKFLLFSYFDEENKIYKKSLESEKENQLVGNNDSKEKNKCSMIIDFDVAKSDYDESASIDLTPKRFFIDLAINNKSNHIIVLTQRGLLIYDNVGNFISKLDLSQVLANMNHFEPSSISIDENENEIIIGNVDNTESAFSLKIKYTTENDSTQEGDPHKNRHRFSYNFLRYNGRSERIFHGKAKTKYHLHCNQEKRIVIANIISKENGSQKNTDTCTEIELTEKIKDFCISQDNNNISPSWDWGYTSPEILKIIILNQTEIFDTDKKGEIKSIFLDVLQEQSRWDKIRIVQENQPGGNIRIKYYCSDLKNEPSENDWIDGIQNANVISLLDCKGRYLKIKIIFSTSDERFSPILKKLYIHYAPKSYLNYLPYIYQENEQNRIFLERFLAIFQNFYEDIEIKLHKFTQLLDADAVPSEFLPWLSSWLAITNERTGWSFESQKLFLKQAPYIFKKRGTKEGLEEMISIYLSRTVNDKGSNCEIKASSNEKKTNKAKLFHVVERLTLYDEDQINAINQLENGPDKSVASLSGGKELPYNFYVLLNSSHVSERDIQNIEKIVEQEKPAHTVAKIYKLPSSLMLENNLNLGIDSLIERKGQLRLGTGQLGSNSVLG